MTDGDVKRVRTRARDRLRSAVQSELVDRVATVIGFAIPFVTWTRTGANYQRVADVEVPNGILMPLLLFRWVGLRRNDRALVQVRDSMSELGEALGERMRYTDQRSERLVDLQASLEQLARDADERDRHLVGLTASVERLTRWLVRLTVVLGLIGVAGIAVAIWAAVR